jgi:transposase
MNTNFIGIDVGCKELVVCVRINGKSKKPKTFSNTSAGHLSLIKHLSKPNRVALVCLEATGTYHFDIAVALSLANDIEVMVINPKVAHHFAGALSERNKTDAVDAGVLAVFCQNMPFVAWQPPSKSKRHLRDISRRLSGLNKQKVQSKNQLHALKSTKQSATIVIEDLHDSIIALENRIEVLREAAVALIEKNDTLMRAFNLLLTIKGIAQASAIQIMGELMVLPDDMTVRQWVASAGLDPRKFTSGSSVSKAQRITKAGNRYLRLALYMPALVASRFEPNIKAYYNHLIEDNGLKKIQAICAVMRKLLHAIYGMFKSQAEFDGSRFYTPATNV